jgi:hypothetical protein
MWSPWALFAVASMKIQTAMAIAQMMHLATGGLRRELTFISVVPIRL